MITRKFEEQPIAKTAHGVDARGMYETDDAAVSIISLKPGEALKRHITPVDVAFFVLETRARWRWVRRSRRWGGTPWSRARRTSCTAGTTLATSCCDSW